MCIKGPGRVNWLIRAASVGGHELGMTQFARVVAAALSVTLGPSVAHQFHVLAPCNVIGGVHMSHVHAHVTCACTCACTCKHLTCVDFAVPIYPGQDVRLSPA